MRSTVLALLFLLVAGLTYAQPVPAENLQWFVVTGHPQDRIDIELLAIRVPEKYKLVHAGGVEGVALVPQKVAVVRYACQCVEHHYWESEYRVRDASNRPTAWLLIPVTNDQYDRDTVISAYVMDQTKTIIPWRSPTVPTQRLSQIPHVAYCDAPFVACEPGRRRTVRP
jgi:hypothetical protein